MGSNKSLIRRFVDLVIISVVAIGTLAVFVWIAEKLTPSNEDGSKPKWLVIVITALLFALALDILSAAIAPPYHPITHATPDEARLMIMRKCVLKYTDMPKVLPQDNMIRAACVPLDAPDLPMDIIAKQGSYITKYSELRDPRTELDSRGIKYFVSGFSYGQLIGGDTWGIIYKGPIWMYSDGSRPSSNKYWIF